jgi:hypothetical protein
MDDEPVGFPYSATINRSLTAQITKIFFNIIKILRFVSLPVGLIRPGTVLSAVIHIMESSTR